MSLLYRYSEAIGIVLETHFGFASSDGSPVGDSLTKIGV